jgi:hypothetical protein
MMPSRIKRGPGKLARQVDFVATFMGHIEESLKPSLRPTRRAVVVAQGAGNTLKLAPTGEGTTHDGYDYPVIVPYTTTTVGAPGGPAANDNVIIWNPSPNQPIVLGKMVT